MKKKIVAATMLAAMCLSLAACGNNTAKDSTETSSEAVESTESKSESVDATESTEAVNEGESTEGVSEEATEVTEEAEETYGESEFKLRYGDTAFDTLKVGDVAMVYDPNLFNVSDNKLVFKTNDKCSIEINQPESDFDAAVAAAKEGVDANEITEAEGTDTRYENYNDFYITTDNGLTLFRTFTKDGKTYQIKATYFVDKQEDMVTDDFDVIFFTASYID